MWKHDLKRYGNLFRKELDKLLDGILRKVVDNVYNEITVKE